MAEFKHYSVLLQETIGGLNIRPEGIYVDGTLGGGGHSWEIARRLTTGHLYGIDQDDAAMEAAGRRLEPVADRVTLLRGNYSNGADLLAGMGVKGVDGIVLDLGVSSYQLDTGERGFSYRYDAPLDMRMDRRQSLTARDIVNEYSEKDLFHMIKEYGEDPFAKNIAKHIVQARTRGPIETTFELNEIVKAAIPARMRQNGHPSKRTFQAIRIECNRELEVLSQSLESLIDLLNEGGRLCIITFHSLEDRIVKQAFRRAEDPCICPPEFPVCVCGRRPKGRSVSRKPILPSRQELEENSRSKSAKLRIFEKKSNSR